METWLAVALCAEMAETWSAIGRVQGLLVQGKSEEASRLLDQTARTILHKRGDAASPRTQERPR
jgi:hypothetical protein